MSETPDLPLSVATLLAEREARRRQERAGEEQLRRKQEEELSAFKERLENFKLTDAQIEVVLYRIRRAFERGETELMLASFPSSFCTDGGRAIGNADLPPVNRPDNTRAVDPAREPEWLATLPAGVRVVYDYWKTHLKQGGFDFTVRIIDYPGGKPGNVGLFFSWSKSVSRM